MPRRVKTFISARTDDGKGASRAERKISVYLRPDLQRSKREKITFPACVKPSEERRPRAGQSASELFELC